MFISILKQLLNAQEQMGEEIKPLRFKEIRSSTASDKGVMIEKFFIKSFIIYFFHKDC